MFTDGIQRPISDNAAYWLDKTKDVGGWLTPAEGQALYELACNVSAGIIVELGSYMGKSSIMLAGGLIDTNEHNSKLYCIDLFQIPSDEPNLSKYGNGDIRPIFTRNIRYADADLVIEAIAGHTAYVASNWCKPIDLLFIDADHTYEGVQADYDNWEPFLQVGGYIAFHDANGSWESVTKFVNEIMATGKFDDITAVDSLVFAKKVAW